VVAKATNSTDGEIRPSPLKGGTPQAGRYVDVQLAFPCCDGRRRLAGLIEGLGPVALVDPFRTGAAELLRPSEGPVSRLTKAGTSRATVSSGWAGNRLGRLLYSPGLR
jgi:hypothetical protein